MKNITKLALAVLILMITAGTASAATINVGTGSTYGSYACDGTDDQVQINAALAAAGNGGTVYLHSATYRITSTVYIPTGITLTGDASVVIQAASDYFNTKPRAMIQTSASSESNIVIHGFKVDGNRDEIGGGVGHGYENLIYLIGVTGVKIYDMQYYDGNSDCMKLDRCSNVEIYNCKVTKSGHEGVYASSCNGIRVHDCTMDINTNCGIRFYNCPNAEGDHNTIYCTTGSGASAFELDHYGDGSSLNTKVHHNVISNTPHWGIWLFSRSCQVANTNYANVYNNIIYDCDHHSGDHNGRGGISVQCWNALIENNIIDANNVNGVYIGSNFGSDSTGSGYSVTLRHNIISNTVGTYAVNCGEPSKYIVSLDTNDLYNPSTVTGVDSNSGTLTGNPQYANQASHQYIPLDPSSPMWRFFQDWSTYTGGIPGGIPGGTSSESDSSGSAGGGELSGEPLPVYNGSTLPALLKPLDSQNVLTFQGKQTFSWSDVNSTKYNLQVANASNFSAGNMIYDIEVTTTSTSQALDAGKYYFRLRAYDDVGHAWTNFTAAKSFTVTGNSDTAGGTVSGQVLDSSSKKPIYGAVVTVVSNTANWSNTFVTDSSGYYVLDVPEAGSYTLFAAATDYQSTITGLPVTLSGSSAGQDIALVKAQSYFAPNYVTYTVSSIYGTRYGGVSVIAYPIETNIDTLSDPVAESSGTTDSNGQITLKLDQSKNYLLEVSDPIQNIDAEFTRSGSGGVPWLIVWGATKKDQNQELPQAPKPEDYIAYGISASQINLSYGYINQTISSKDGQLLSFSTSIRSIDVYGKTDGMFTYLSSGTGDVNISTIAPRNMTFYVNTTITHPVVSKTYSRAIELKGSDIRKGLDLGFESQWQYEFLGMILMFLFAGLFGRRNQGMGAFMIVLIGCFCMWSGWFAYDLTQSIMAMFGIMLTFMYLISRRD